MARLTFFRTLTSRLSLRHQSSSNTLNTDSTADSLHPPRSARAHDSSTTPDSLVSSKFLLRHSLRSDDAASSDTPATSISCSDSPSPALSESLALPAAASRKQHANKKAASRSLSVRSRRAESSPPLPVSSTVASCDPPSDIEPVHADDLHGQPNRRHTVDFSPANPSPASSASPTTSNGSDDCLVNASRESTQCDSSSRPVSVSSALPAPLINREDVPVASAAAPKMVLRKIWIKRPNGSATMVQIKDDDLVDDVRDMVLRKYANSLGRSFDAPDMVLRIVARAEHGGPRVDRALSPEEEMIQTIDAYYPNGQTIDDALIIDVPSKRSTPRASPRHPAMTHYAPNYPALDDFRPHESGTDYFPPMPAVIPSGMLSLAPTSLSIHNGREHHSLAPGDHPKSMSVVNTGTIPMIPSPGAGPTSNPNRTRYKDRGEHRPRTLRHNTSSPTIISHPPPPAANLAMATPLTQQPPPPSSPQLHPHRTSTRGHPDSAATASASDALLSNGVVPAAPPLPSPPAPQAEPTNRVGSTPPTPNGSVANGPPRPRRGYTKSTSKHTGRDGRRSKQSQLADQNGASPALPSIASMLDSSVPPINVLIVEDNHITLRILESLMKRLKVRWQTAMNGQIAVDKWKKGGFHLVLMDIQMPVMNGLQATKEIRRLERVNGIGVFPASNPASPAVAADPSQDEQHIKANGADGAEPAANSADRTADDDLPLTEGLFKSPVILVALTASSLQSDRNEALAAGCNDFLTKPVDFVWLERKVKEWGCMQALIDFDGWRKWKAIAAQEEAGKSDEQKQKERAQEEKQRFRAEKMARLQAMQAEKKRAEEKEKERKRAAGAGAATAAAPVASAGTGESQTLEGDESAQSKSSPTHRSSLSATTIIAASPPATASDEASMQEPPDANGSSSFTPLPPAATNAVPSPRAADSSALAV